jgi:hypothetical protein
VSKTPFIFLSEIQKNEKYNKNNSLKKFDNFVSACHLLFVGGRQQPLTDRRRNENPTGVPTQGFLNRKT